MALITIAIPVYNEEEYLRETIESALAQDYADMEVVVYDNQSTDKSYEIAKEYEQGNDCFKVIRHSTNIGPAENFRQSLLLAETKYFAWLGAHDLFNCDYISKAVEYLEVHPEAAMVYPRDAVFIDSSNGLIGQGACSAIELKNERSPVKRMCFVVENLVQCTNIHGVFVTDVAKKLPFEKVIGPDNLMLAITAFYGEVHALDIEGIRRREVRQETDEASEARWIEQAVFSRTWCHPRLVLIWKHLEFVLSSDEIGLTEKFAFLVRAPMVFRWWRPLKMTVRRLWAG